MKCLRLMDGFVACQISDGEKIYDNRIEYPIDAGDRIMPWITRIWQRIRITSITDEHSCSLLDLPPFQLVWNIKVLAVYYMIVHLYLATIPGEQVQGLTGSP